MKLRAGGNHWTKSSNRVVRIMALPALALAIFIGLIGPGEQAMAGVRAGIPFASDPSNKVERAVLDDTANGKSASFVVLMADQANINAAYGMKDQDARGWYVYSTLAAHASRTQAGVQAMLKAQGAAYRSFWAANMLVVTGNRALVDALAARPDVGRLESNRPFKGISDPTEIAPASPPTGSPSAVEWGVQNVRAPQVWAMGFTGQGIVIGNQDTGMRWSHNALKPHYRGWNGSTADHNFNWWDAIHSAGGSCGANSQVPCDDQGHGTHTTGTTSGDDGTGNQVGVAPGAKWIGCRNMNVGVGTPATYTECFQFFMAPTDLNGQNPNPALRPHVMNNSWGCPPSEGCAPDTLRAIIENTQASGILVEASAGNSGSSCSTVNDPPALYAASFSTGATEINNALAAYSSRGPVTLDGSNRLKPNISAPGSGVRSSTRGSDSSYGSSSGTSMAGPHVVGVVALVWSAHPELSRMITETKNLLQNTANPNVIVNPVQICGGTRSDQIPNNSFGYGRVDALAAVKGTGGTPTPTPIPTCAPSFAGVQISDFMFSPQTVTVYTGATVRWTNFGPTVHTATSDTGVWDSGNIAVNDFYQRTFDTPGVYPYHCAPHPGMTGTITVLAGCPPTLTPTRTNTPTLSPTSTRSVTSTPTRPTMTSCPTVGLPTFTSTRPPTNTGTPATTLTPKNDPGTPTVTRTTTPTSTPCSMPFTDVHSNDYFHGGVRWLYCRGAISGYGDGTFRPFNNTTRGQMVKIIVLGYGLPTYVPPEPTFRDVPTIDPFYSFIETAAHANIVSGYTCGAPGEPCPGLYYRPNNMITRAQLTKIIVTAAGWPLINPTTAHFNDVARGSTFYEVIETAYCHQVLSGYDCGNPGEPCPGMYFRQGNNATRGQIAKMVFNAISNLDCAPLSAAP